MHELEGRVPEPCGECGWPCLEPSTYHASDGPDRSHQMPKARCRPLALPVDTPGPLTLTIPHAPVLLTACGKDVASPYRS